MYLGITVRFSLYLGLCRLSLILGEHAIGLNLNGYIFGFSTVYVKGSNSCDFLLAPLSKIVSILKKGIFPRGATYFLKDLTLIEKECANEND